MLPVQIDGEIEMSTFFKGEPFAWAKPSTKAEINAAFADPTYLARVEAERHIGHKAIPVMKLIPLCQPCARRKVLWHARQAPWTTAGQHRERILSAYAWEWGEVIEAKKWEAKR